MRRSAGVALLILAFAATPAVGNDNTTQQMRGDFALVNFGQFDSCIVASWFFSAYQLSDHVSGTSNGTDPPIAYELKGSAFDRCNDTFTETAATGTLPPGPLSVGEGTATINASFLAPSMCSSFGGGKSGGNGGCPNVPVTVTLTLTAVESTNSMINFREVLSGGFLYHLREQGETSEATVAGSITIGSLTYVATSSNSDASFGTINNGTLYISRPQTLPQ